MAGASYQRLPVLTNQPRADLHPPERVKITAVRRFARFAVLAFAPRDGGTLELSGVFGGSVSRASSAAIHRSAASRRSRSARISASFSAPLRRLSS
jgi:hypothetical protein